MSHVIALVAFSFVTFLAGYGAAAWTDRKPRSHPWIEIAVLSFAALAWFLR